MRAALTALAAAASLAPPAAASDWTLDREASSVEFTATAFDQPVDGAFTDFDAEITLDPDNLEPARIDAVVRTQPNVIKAEYVDSLNSSAGLAPGDHPEMRFSSDAITRTEEGYAAEGELTIKGVSQPFTLPFTLDIQGDRATAQSNFTLDRTDFGVGSGSWGDVGEALEVRLHVEADRAP